jgi:F-type H+-transporting ATPase subunit c
MTMKNLFLLALLLLVASPVFAQGQAAPAESHTNWAVVGALASMAVASGLCGLAQGKAVSAASEAMARNPGAAANIRGALILGLVLIESLALYVLLIFFMKV